MCVLIICIQKLYAKKCGCANCASYTRKSLPLPQKTLTFLYARKNESGENVYGVFQPSDAGIGYLRSCFEFEQPVILKQKSAINFCKRSKTLESRLATFNFYPNFCNKLM